MLEFKKEYFQTETNRHLYPTTLDLSKAEVYGCKDREAYMYKIPNNRYTSNAGNIDFSLYPNGVWSDYTGIKIVERLPFFQPSINFNKLGDITPSNLNKLKEEIRQHIVDLETAITESVNFIDSGVPGQNNLPYLPEGCVWFRDPIIKDVIALPISELYEKFGNLIKAMEKVLDEYIEQKKEEIRGPAGAIDNVTASVNSNAGTPKVTVSLGGTPERRKIDLKFENLKGDKPIKGTDYYTPTERQEFTTETLRLVKAEGNQVLEQFRKLVAGNPATTNAQSLSGKTRIEFEKDVKDIGISPNLYDPASAKRDVAISSGDGTEMPGFSGWITTGYIPVTTGDVIYFSSNENPTTYSTGAFYNDNYQAVKFFGNDGANTSIKVTSNGYAKFSFDKSKEKLQIEKTKITPYLPYGKVLLTLDVEKTKEDITFLNSNINDLQKQVSSVQEDHTNLFNKDTVSTGAILHDNGIFDTFFSDWQSSDYIPVKPGMTLYFSSNSKPYGACSSGAYYDKDKKYISGIKDEPLSIIVPSNAYYLRFSKNGGFKENLNTLKLEQYGITKFTPFGEKYVIFKENALPEKAMPKWENLKILTLGDSITAMGGVNGWTHWIQEYLHTEKLVNVSVAGSTWQDRIPNQSYDGNPQSSTDGNVMGNQVQKILNEKSKNNPDYQDFDVITFSFGTNDSVDFNVQTKESVEKQFVTNYAQNNYTVIPLDKVDRQTLAGAIRYGFQKLHEAYPNAVIFVCTPTQEAYESFDSIYKKGELIKYIADRCSVEIIDTLKCGIRNIYESQTNIDYDHPELSGPAPIQTDLLDGIHTNESGAKKIAKYNAREIMKYFID